MKPSNGVGRFCLVFALLCVASATAQVRGEYSPGSTLSNAGTLPDPGFSYSNQFWYNSADRLYGRNGQVIPGAGSFFALTDNNSVAYVPKFHFLGAKLQFLIDIAISQGRFDAKNPLNGDLVLVGATGISNTNFVPLELGWSRKRLDLQTGLSIYAPTGRYTPHAPDNLSSGYWTIGWQAGATLYLNQSKSNQASIYTVYAWNTVQQGTNVRPGQNVSLDYSLSHTFHLGKSDKWTLLAGPAGYGQWQTTDDQGRATNPIRYTIDAIGFTSNLSTPYKGLYVGTSLLYEYGARNTYEGRTSVITGGLNF